MDKLRILFCDNMKPKHRAFATSVMRRLKAHRQEQVEYEFYHSQSLDQYYEQEYTVPGASSVETFLQHGMTFDLVITDLDFELDETKGQSNTGLQIVEQISAITSRESPWTRYIVMTHFSDRMDTKAAMELTRLRVLAPEDYVPFEDVRSGANWDLVFQRAVLHIDGILRLKRAKLEISTSIPALYRVDAFVRTEEVQPMGIVLWTPDEERCIQFVLKRQAYTFAVLATNPLPTWIPQERVRKSVATLLKAVPQYPSDTDPHPTVEAIRGHVGSIRKEVQEKAKILVGPRTVATLEHDGPHDSAPICAKCFLHRAVKAAADFDRGYGLAASVNWFLLERNDSMETAMRSCFERQMSPGKGAPPAFLSAALSETHTR